MYDYMRKHYVFIGLISLVLFAGCEQFDDLESLDTVRFDAEYAIPLIDTRIDLPELLQNLDETTEVIVDGNGLIRFRYRGDVITQTSEDIFASINESLPPIIPVTKPRMALPFSTPDGVLIDRVDLRDGQLIYLVEHKHPDKVDVKIRFPQVVKNGQPLVLTASMPPYVAGSSTPSRATNFFAPASLAGYSIIAERDSIYVEYEAVRSDGRRDTLSSALLRIQNLAITYAEGFFGKQVYKGGRDTIAIDFFNNWVGGDVYFEDPRVTFLVDNAFGIPTRSVVNLFNVLTVRGQVLPLTGDLVTKGIDFPYPGLNEVGTVKSTTFVFNKDNSNIDKLLGAGPVALDYDVDALTNPDNNPAIRGFITDSSFYRVRVEVELPLYGTAAGFVARDTFDIDLGQFDGADRAEFKLVADNELPLGIDLQGYFLDESGAVLDSLLDSPRRVVGPAPVNDQGIAYDSTRQITIVPFPADRFTHIRNARFLALHASFSTTDEGTRPVRPLSEQQLHVRIGTILGVKRE